MRTWLRMRDGGFWRCLHAARALVQKSVRLRRKAATTGDNERTPLVPGNTFDLRSYHVCRVLRPFNLICLLHVCSKNLRSDK